MKFSTDIRHISFLRSNTTEVVRNLEAGGNPLVITQNGEAKIVIQDVHAYEKREEALALLGILALGKVDVQERRGIDAAEFRKKLAALEPG